MAWLPQNITHSNISQPSGVLECINIYISTLSYLSTVLRIIQAFSQCLSPSTLLKHALQGGWWLTYHSYSINTVEAPSSTLSLQISGKITIVGERNVVSTIFLLNPPLLFHTQTLILHRWFSLLKPAVFLIRLQFVHLRHLSFSSWIIITQPDNAVGSHLSEAYGKGGLEGTQNNYSKFEMYALMLSPVLLSNELGVVKGKQYIFMWLVQKIISPQSIWLWWVTVFWTDRSAESHCCTIALPWNRRFS